MFRALFLAVAAVSLLAQTPTPAFEVASVKPFSIGQTDAPVTLGARIDGAQARLVGLTMRDLLAMAYRVKIYQLSGPDWITSERYDINAKVPAGVRTRTSPHDGGGAAPGMQSAPSIMTMLAPGTRASASASGRACSMVSSRPIVTSAACAARRRAAPPRR